MTPGPMALWPHILVSRTLTNGPCSVFVNLHVLRVLFCQPVFSIFEFYAGNYTFVFAFEY